MTDTKKETAARTILRKTIMRFAKGIPPKKADAMVDEIRAGWPMFDSFDTLEKVVKVVSPGYLSPAAVLFWMHSSLLVMESRNGCELTLAAGLRAAARCGVTSALLDTLRTQVVDAVPTDETRH